MDSASKKYKVLYTAIAEMGITDPEQIEKLIEQLNSFSNLLIDLFLEYKKCETA